MEERRLNVSFRSILMKSAENARPFIAISKTENAKNLKQ